MRFRSVLEEFEVKLRPLTAEASAARGKGEWKLYGDHSRQCKLSVTGLNLPDGTELQLTVSGRVIAEVPVDRGSIRLRRETEKGEFVSHVRADEVLQVLLSGKAILEGTFYTE
jgi:hypothetical protein